MRHQRQRYQLSRSPSHRKALLVNPTKELMDHRRHQTTAAKDKAVKPEVEKLSTLAKRGDLHARREALSALGQDKFVVYKLFEEVAPRYADRPGGYTRILKLGPRRSDSTEMVSLALVCAGEPLARALLLRPQLALRLPGRAACGRGPARRGRLAADRVRRHDPRDRKDHGVSARRPSCG